MSGHLALGGHHVVYGFTTERKGATRPWVKQVHGPDFEIAKEILAPETAKPADAVLTQKVGSEIYVYTADCLPVLLAAPETENCPATVAAIHSGWRGTMRGVIPNVLRNWPAPLEQTRAIIGPAIGPCHFEVKEDFIDEFSRAYPDIASFIDTRDGKTFFRLLDFVCDRQLGDLELEQIDRSQCVCTYCAEPALPSFRRNQGTDPQIRAWIRIELSH